MKTIQFGKRAIRIPTQISELNTEQLVRFVELQNAGLTITQFNVWMMLNVLDISRRPWLKWYFFKNEYLIPFLDKLTFGVFTWKVSEITPEDLHEVCISFPEFQKSDNFPLDNPFPTLKLSFSTTCEGPTKLLNNLTFRQFRKAEEYFAKFYAKKSPIDLNLLIAWLYVPEKKNIRCMLTPIFVENRAKSIEALPHAKKLTILHFYLANREKIVKFYPFLYPKRKDISTAKTRIPYQIMRDFEKSVRILSPDITKDEETDLQNIHDALAHLNDKAEQVAKMKEITQNQGK